MVAPDSEPPRDRRTTCPEELRERLSLRRLPLLGEDSAGPLGPGLLSAGALGTAISRIQADLHR